MPLTTDELALLRLEAQTWMEDTCSIYRETPAEDVYGGVSVSEALLTSGVPCMVQSGASHEQVTQLVGLVRGTHLFTITLPAETDVRVGDNLVLTSQSNLKLRVQALLRPETREIMRQVIASTQL